MIQRTTVKETTVEYDEDGNVIKSVTTETTTEYDFSTTYVPPYPPYQPYAPPVVPYVSPVICGTSIMPCISSRPDYATN